MFLAGHHDKVRAKFFRSQQLLELYGPDLKRPHADMLRDGIRELRVGFGGNTYRALFFFMIRDVIVITHAFIKKTDKVPDGEIDRALRYKQDLEERVRSGEEEL